MIVMAIRLINEREVVVAVRDLVQPAEQTVISSFPLPQRGVLGKKAQARFQQKKEQRFGLFHREFSVSQSYEYRGFRFHIQGRVDGLYELPQRLEIEEIKSVLLDARTFRTLKIENYPHFSEQLLFYAYLLQDAFKGIEIKTYLILLNLINNRQRTFKVKYNRQQTERLLLERLGRIVDQIEADRRKAEERKIQLKKVSFSLPEKRPQQQEMMKAVESVLEEKKHLMVSAPTGTGKTAAALFPAVRYAFVRGKKIFFVTSKTSQQAIAAQTLQPLIAAGLPIKTMVISASQKMCLNDVYFCHESYCPYVKNYRERLNKSNLLQVLLQNAFLDNFTISVAAAEKELCPFEVSMDLLPHVDVLIGDYNYVFDPAVRLRRLFSRKDYSDWILIVDEAHNLYDRGMAYLSPQLLRRQVKNLKAQTEAYKNKIYRELKTALEELENLLDALQTEGEIHHEGKQYFKTQLNLEQWKEVFRLYEAAFIRYLIYKIRTHKLIVDDPLETFYYQFRRFVQVAQMEDRAFVTFYDAGDGGTLNIQCCDPSHYLGEIIDHFHSVIAMSATLDPMEFFQTLLGFLPERTQRLRLDSPFPNEHRRLVIVPNISTRYKDRMKNAPRIARVIEEVIRLKEGNYLVFFPSFEFLQLVNLFLGNVKIEKILQRPGMKEKDRDQILHRLQNEPEPHLLLAVMGGIFSEGVDFTGDMAIGVIVVGPALPQVNYRRELLREYYDLVYEAGTEYAYIYPGMNKVIQAVGRLIRTVGDRGVAILIGERFADEQFNIMLPEYWFKDSHDIVITSDVVPAVRSFWEKVKRA